MTALEPRRGTTNARACEQELAEALRACGNLGYLDLGSNGLDFVEAVRLWPLVAHCSALRRMDMSQNMLRHHALRNFAIVPVRLTQHWRLGCSHRMA